MEAIEGLISLDTFVGYALFSRHIWDFDSFERLNHMKYISGDRQRNECLEFEEVGIILASK